MKFLRMLKKVAEITDHIHLLVSIPPMMSVGKVTGIVKQNTAKEIKLKFPFLSRTGKPPLQGKSPTRLNIRIFGRNKILFYRKSKYRLRLRR